MSSAWGVTDGERLSFAPSNKLIIAFDNSSVLSGEGHSERALDLSQRVPSENPESEQLSACAKNDTTTASANEGPSPWLTPITRDTHIQQAGHAVIIGHDKISTAAGVNLRGASREDFNFGDFSKRNSRSAITHRHTKTKGRLFTVDSLLSSEETA